MMHKLYTKLSMFDHFAI